MIMEAEVNKKLMEKAINISKTKDTDLEVIGDFARMSIKEVATDPSYSMTQGFRFRHFRA
jgi:hypothetical protein